MTLVNPDSSGFSFKICKKVSRCEERWNPCHADWLTCIHWLPLMWLPKSRMFPVHLHAPRMWPGQMICLKGQASSWSESWEAKAWKEQPLALLPHSSMVLIPSTAASAKRFRALGPSCRQMLQGFWPTWRWHLWHRMCPLPQLKMGPVLGTSKQMGHSKSLRKLWSLLSDSERKILHLLHPSSLNASMSGLIRTSTAGCGSSAAGNDCTHRKVRVILENVLPIWKMNILSFSSRENRL